MSAPLGNDHSRPSPGELRVARLPGALSRLVLVVGSNPEEPASLVSLVTNELEFATEADVRLEAAETGLAYPVLIETDLVASVWDTQLGPPLGRVVTGLEQNPVPDVEQFDDERRGLPLAGPSDTRWGWKQSELSDLHQLASARTAALAGVNEESREGPEALAAMPVVAVADGVGVSVDPFDPALPPLIRWHGDDEDATFVARLLVELRPALAPALWQLAVAETRLQTHDVPLWQIDRALAALSLEGHVPEEHRAVLAEYIANGAGALLSIADLLGELGADCVGWCLDKLEPLQARMNPRERAALASAREWAHDRQVFGKWPSAALERRAANGMRILPVSPHLAIRGLVDADAPALLAHSGRPDALTASVWLSARASVALRAWQAAARLPVHDVERQRAEVLLEAVTGSRGAALAWLQLFDRSTGAVVDAIPLGPVDDVGDTHTRVELRARVPTELDSPGNCVGAVVAAHPDRALDRKSVISVLLVFVRTAPDAASAFAAAMAHESGDDETVSMLRRIDTAVQPEEETVGERLLTELVWARNRWIDHLGDRLQAAEGAEDSLRATMLVLQEAESVLQSLRTIRRLLP